MDAKEIATQAAPALEASVSKLVGWVEASAQFVADQAPAVAQEMVRFGIVWNGFAAFSLIFISSTTIVGAWWYAYKAEKRDKYLSGMGYCGAILYSIAAAFLLVFGITCLRGFFLALLAPRVYVLEQLRGLL